MELNDAAPAVDAGHRRLLSAHVVDLRRPHAAGGDDPGGSCSYGGLQWQEHCMYARHRSVISMI